MVIANQASSNRPQSFKLELSVASTNDSNWVGWNTRARARARSPSQSREYARAALKISLELRVLRKSRALAIVLNGSPQWETPRSWSVLTFGLINLNGHLNFSVCPLKVKYQTCWQKLETERGCFDETSDQEIYHLPCQVVLQNWTNISIGLQ